MKPNIMVPLSLAAKSYIIGENVTVAISFQYTVGQATKIYLYAAPYVPGQMGVCQGYPAAGHSTGVDLPPAATPAIKTVQVAFPLIPEASGGIADGTYGVTVWSHMTSDDSNPPEDPFDKPEMQASQDNVLIVSGNPSGSGLTDTLSGMMPMLMMVMMLGMMAPMMQRTGGGD